MAESPKRLRDEASSGESEKRPKADGNILLTIISWNSEDPEEPNCWRFEIDGEHLPLLSHRLDFYYNTPLDDLWDEPDDDADGSDHPFAKTLWPLLQRTLAEHEHKRGNLDALDTPECRALFDALPHLPATWKAHLSTGLISLTNCTHTVNVWLESL